MTAISADERLLLVGAGKMGTALLRGWLDKGVLSDTQVYVIEPSPAAGFRAVQSEHGGITLLSSIQELTQESPEMVVLAVKPQIMADVARDLRGVANAESLFLSIAAGTSVGRLKDMLNAPSAYIVRTMPNTPATIGEGVTAFFASDTCSDSHILKVEHLLNAVGTTIRLSDEALMDAVTALSGSGPAYVFLFIEKLVAAGIKVGLPSETATELAIQTLVGAAKLAQQSPMSASELREQVTSPNGTTAAALGVFMSDDALGSLVDKAVQAAFERSRELNES